MEKKFISKREFKKLKFFYKLDYIDLMLLYAVSHKQYNRVVKHFKKIGVIGNDKGDGWVLNKYFYEKIGGIIEQKVF